MDEQPSQQITGQVAPSTQNPQSGATSQLMPIDQSPLQGSDIQQVLGSQNSRIIVPESSTGAVSSPSPEPPHTQNEFTLWPILVVAVILLAAIHVYTLSRRRRQQKLPEQAGAIIQPSVQPETKPPKKKKSKKSKRKARR